MKNNVFINLFRYRLRPAKSSDENFLTEALAYVLREDDQACRVWVADPLGVEPAQIRKCHVLTQTTYPAEERAGRDNPDMEVRCELADGTRAVVLSEHKWGGIDVGQLDRYCGVRDGLQSSGVNARLLFVGSDYESWAQAEGHCDQRLLWEHVYTRLGAVAARSGALSSLLEFLEENGLSPAEPLSPSKLVAYAMSRTVPRQLRSIMQKLRGSFDWGFLPAAYRDAARLWPVRTTDDSMEVVEFGFPHGLRPLVGMGFKKKPDAVTEDLSKPEHGIDLLLYLWADGRDIEGVAVNDKANVLRKRYGKSVRVLDQIDRSPWREYRLAVLRPVMDVLRGHKEEEQLASLYDQFREWGEVLFADGELERAFRQTWPEAWKDK